MIEAPHRIVDVVQVIKAQVYFVGSDDARLAAAATTLHPRVGKVQQSSLSLSPRFSGMSINCRVGDGIVFVFAGIGHVSHGVEGDGGKIALLFDGSQTQKVETAQRMSSIGSHVG